MTPGIIVQPSADSLEESEGYLGSAGAPDHLDDRDEDEDRDVDENWDEDEDGDWDVDLDEDENFALSVKNRKGTSEFLITLDSGRRCEASQSVGEGDCGGSGSGICDVDDDRNCRCNKRGTECCDDSGSRCKKNCCTDCTKDEERNGDCNLCDSRSRNCMKLSK